MKQINEILEDLTDELKDTLIKSYIEDIYRLKEENSKLLKNYNNLKLNHDNLLNLYNQRIKDIQNRDNIINNIRNYIEELSLRRYINKDLNKLKSVTCENLLYIINGD